MRSLLPPGLSPRQRELVEALAAEVARAGGDVCLTLKERRRLRRKLGARDRHELNDAVCDALVELRLLQWGVCVWAGKFHTRVTIARPALAA